MKTLSIKEFIDRATERCIIDVRSEGEFKKGRIATATNIPLFNNEERAKVGTTYKQVGKQEAIMEGLAYVGPKMVSMIQQVNAISSSKEVFIYCWRGGMRSRSFGWLLETVGYQVYLLEGGYKSYRRMVNEFINTTQLKLHVIGGCTGSGKTEMLRVLAQKGEQTIDLEKLAHHKGSAFGGLGQPETPSKENFDNQLYSLLSGMDLTKPIWIEDESRNIGKIFLPLNLTQHITESPVYCLKVSKEERIKRLVDEYSVHPKEELMDCVDRIKKRLGGLVVKDAMQALEENNYGHFAELILFYYDRTYIKQLEDKKSRIVMEIEITNQNYEKATEQLLQG